MTGTGCLFDSLDTNLNHVWQMFFKTMIHHQDVIYPA